MKLLKDHPEISFKILDKQHNIIPGIKYAFLKEELFNIERDSVNVRIKDGVQYELYWDFSHGEPNVPVGTVGIPVVVSYREQNGKKLAIIRPKFSSK